MLLPDAHMPGELPAMPVAQQLPARHAEGARDQIGREELLAAGFLEDLAGGFDPDHERHR